MGIDFGLECREGRLWWLYSPLGTIYPSSSAVFRARPHEYLYPTSITIYAHGRWTPGWKLCGYFFVLAALFYYYWCEGRRGLAVWYSSFVNHSFGVFEMYVIYIYKWYGLGGDSLGGRGDIRMKAAYKSIAIKFYFKWEGCQFIYAANLNIATHVISQIKSSSLFNNFYRVQTIRIDQH